MLNNFIQTTDSTHLKKCVDKTFNSYYSNIGEGQIRIMLLGMVNQEVML